MPGDDGLVVVEGQFLDGPEGRLLFAFCARGAEFLESRDRNGKSVAARYRGYAGPRPQD
jgi:hypothetical protein